MTVAHETLYVARILRLHGVRVQNDGDGDERDERGVCDGRGHGASDGCSHRVCWRVGLGADRTDGEYLRAARAGSGKSSSCE